MENKLKELITLRDKLVAGNSFTEGQALELQRAVKAKAEASVELANLNKEITETNENARLFSIFIDLYLSDKDKEAPEQPDVIATILTKENVIAAGRSVQENLDHINKAIDRVFNKTKDNSEDIKKRLKELILTTKPFLEVQEKVEITKMEMVIDTIKEAVAKKNARQEKKKARKAGISKGKKK